MYSLLHGYFSIYIWLLHAISHIVIPSVYCIIFTQTDGAFILLLNEEKGCVR